MSAHLSPDYQTNCRATTLAELLVALAIVVVLAGLLFSSVKKMRQTSQSSLCVSNLKQLGVAANLYFGDHRQIIPMQPNTQSEGWMHALAPYLGLIPHESIEAPVFSCPGDLSPAGPQIRSYRWNLSRNIPGGSAAVGSYTILQLQPASQRNRTTLFKYPSKHAMIFDVSYTGKARFELWRNNNNSWGDTYDLQLYPPDNPGEYPRPHHDNRAINILYYDGHISPALYPLPYETYYWSDPVTPSL